MTCDPNRCHYFARTDWGAGFSFSEQCKEPKEHSGEHCSSGGHATLTSWREYLCGKNCTIKKKPETMVEKLPIEKHEINLERAIDALLIIVASHDHKDMVLAAAKALGQIGVSLPKDIPPVVVAYHEAAKK